MSYSPLGRAGAMICPSCQAENAEGHEACSGCGQSLVGTAIIRGSVVSGRYEILSPLGKGGMGMVFKAHDRVLDENVALKVLRADIARAPDMERRFRSEIKLARRVRHRNVCGIHEYGEDGPLRYIAMELIEGTDLKHLLRDKGALPPLEAYEVAIQLAKGLEAIHDAGVVHRDLKTSNVMLDSQGQVRLMDFGIAKQLGGEATLGATAIGHIIGTPEYMSPEQARGDKIDFRSDVYSLGVVVYEIFTGHVPFHGETPIATIFKTLEEPPTLEGPMAAGIPGPLVPVLAKALAKDQSDRYASARVMIDALREARSRTLPDEVVTPAPGAPPTILIRSEPTRVPRPLPTPVPTPTPQPVPVTVVRPPSAPAPSPPPPPHRPAPRAAAAARPSALPQRSVLPWLVTAGVLFAVAVGALVWTAHRLLSGPPLSTMGTVPAQPAPPAPTPTARSPEATPTPQPGSASGAAEVATTTPETPPARSTGLPRASPVAARPSPRPRPTPPAARASPAVETVSSPPPAPAAPRSAPPQEQGLLQLRVKPWAAVSVDDEYVGTTPLQPIRLSPGSHTVRLTHPDYKVLQRKVTIRPSETTRLEVDLQWDAVPKGPTEEPR